MSFNFWDLCAPEAILRAMGGVATNHAQNRYCYLKERNGGTAKISGLVLAKTPGIH